MLTKSEETEVAPTVKLSKFEVSLAIWLAIYDSLPVYQYLFVILLFIGSAVGMHNFAHVEVPMNLALAFMFTAFFGAVGLLVIPQLTKHFTEYLDTKYKKALRQRQRQLQEKVVSNVDNIILK